MSKRNDFDQASSVYYTIPELIKNGFDLNPSSKKSQAPSVGDWVFDTEKNKHISLLNGLTIGCRYVSDETIRKIVKYLEMY